MNTKTQTGNPDLDLAIKAYMAYVIEDYRLHSAMGKHETMRLRAEVGRKFTKIVDVTGQVRVHSFIVNHEFTTSAKAGNLFFRAGDILMAATYNAPALNKARGNVLDLNYGSTSWTGAGYL